ncbi:MAG: hypothetical protein U0229_24710 [Anaeromyxobacter sp.]
MELKSGLLVKHASLGLGKVVAVDKDAVHVVFADGDPRQATKLRLPMALSFFTPAPAANPWLSGLTGFALDEKSGRYGRAASSLSHQEAVARFTAEFPEAFRDRAYLEADGAKSDRAVRWRRASAEYAAAFGDGRGEKLLEAGQLRALLEGARKIEKHLKVQARESDREPVDAWLGDPERATAYWEALFAFAGAARPQRARFEALAAAVAELEVEEAETGWRLVTLFPFLARPDLHVLVRPRFVREAAQRLELDVAYDAVPNWTSYASLVAASAALLEKLKPLGARDHADVEVFMQVALAKPVKAKKPVAARPGLPAKVPAPKAAVAKQSAPKEAPAKAAAAKSTAKRKAAGAGKRAQQAT